MLFAHVHRGSVYIIAPINTTIFLVLSQSYRFKFLQKKEKKNLFTNKSDLDCLNLLDVYKLQ